MPPSPFTRDVIDALRAIPQGRVATYGGLAALVGNPRAARQVVRVLHTYSSREDLPWHRVINSQGCISLPSGGGFEEQVELLRTESVEVSDQGKVDLGIYLWDELKGVGKP